MSVSIAKLFKNPLALASAALVMHIGAAAAADSTGDIQQQVRDLLAGTTTVAHSTLQSGSREGNATSSTVDSQEFVKQLLQGAGASRVRDASTINHTQVAGTPTNAESQQRPVARWDSQAAMRKLLLGQLHASDAS